MKDLDSSGDSGNERTSRPSREPVDRESLEVKLDALIEEMRVTLAAEQAAAAARTEPAVHVTGLLPPASKATEDTAAPKIIVGKGVDPRAEQTIVGRRSPNGAEWIFDGVEEEAPPGAHAPLTRSDAPVERVVVVEAKPRRRAPVMAIAGVAAGVALTWMLLGKGPAPLVLRHVPPPVILAAAAVSPEGTAKPAETGEPHAKPEKPVNPANQGSSTATSQSSRPSWKPKPPRSEPKPRATAIETDRNF